MKEEIKEALEEVVSPGRGPHPAFVPRHHPGYPCGRTTTRARRIGSSLSFKLDPERIPGLPLPLPRFEIFVYSQQHRGEVHPARRKIARSGIRWSDRARGFQDRDPRPHEGPDSEERRDSPRRERRVVFVVKRPPAQGGREGPAAGGHSLYKTLIGSMLDITDNISGDEIVPPPDVTL